ncbi:hypothetical protein BKA60DRAFT_226039 [Fusarium oxysporum]|nr:hypothetical protein BKA60DRAFT_226039 [Fusarium oxysporum]
MYRWISSIDAICVHLWGYMKNLACLLLTHIFYCLASMCLLLVDTLITGVGNIPLMIFTIHSLGHRNKKKIVIHAFLSHYHPEFLGRASILYRHSIANHHIARICRSTPPSCWPCGQFQRFHTIIETWTGVSWTSSTKIRTGTVTDKSFQVS